MADTIGVSRRHHQAPPAHDSHYDICLAKRALAIKAGAIPITLRQLASMNFRRRITGCLGQPEDAEEWMRSWRSMARARGSVSNELTLES